MVSQVKRYFLEIRNFSSKININLEENYQIVLNRKNDFQLNKFFYKQIGVDHYWRDRLVWTDKDWIKYVSNENLETYVLKKGNDLIGYYEQEYHSSSNEIELINLGVLKEFRGLKLGSTLVSHAIFSASKKKPERMWVHTCSLDHKHALQTYKSKGFEIFKKEEINFVA
tara:strand:+ start:191 stop:697 length:507 start_codon:yes stop_codon:yes gene_type:complete